MDDESENLFYLGVGPLAAILLGMALVPLRGLTTASNFTFVFLALTIAVAEFGGRWAAVATALCSALSLDFFLTEPYQRLAIADKHDIIAFVGLTACGLIAAALGSKRGERIAQLRAARGRLELFHATLAEWNPGLPTEPQLEKLLRALRDAFPLRGLALRGLRDHAIATSDAAAGLRSIPETILEADALVPRGALSRFTGRGAPLPEAGGRIAVRLGKQQLGWLDVWGNGLPASLESRRMLGDLARLMAVLLASEGRGGRSRD